MHFDATRLKTCRLVLAPPDRGDVKEMLDYFERNKLNFQLWEPRRSENFYTVQQMGTRITSITSEMLEGHSLYFLLRELDHKKIIGECSFTNIVRGPFQACHLGFSICHEFQGKGLMYEALERAIAFVFGEIKLHRVMANYRPENDRSYRLLQRLGFEQEGRARAYLNIDGQWRDHILTSLINEKFD